MSESPPAARPRAPRGRLVALALALPALAGIHASVRISVPVVRWAAAGEDPVWAAVAGAPDEPVADLLAAAAREAPLHFQYPYWLAVERLTGGRAAPDRGEGGLGALDGLQEAARRAPSVAEARWYQVAAFAGLGRFEEADREARAAIELAPLNRGLMLRVAGYFRDRYRKTHAEAHLVEMLRAAALEERVAEEILSLPLVTYEEVLRLFDLARIGGAKRVAWLEAAGRFEWALRLASESPKAGVRALAPGVRERFGRFLVGRGAFAAAVEELGAARDAAGEEFGGHAALGEALLRTGREAEGRAALAEAVGRGADVSSIRRILSDASMDVSARAEFWRGLAAAPENRPAAGMELARVLLEERRADEAAAAVRPHLDDPQFGAEANFLLARTFVLAGNPAMGRRYAARAAELRPDDRDYAALLKSMPGDGR